MFKRFISMTIAVLLMTTSFSLLGASSAVAVDHTIGSITASGAVVDFQALATAHPSASWVVKVTSNGNCATPVQTVSVTSPTVTATISGLSAGTNYRVCVVHGDGSAWNGGVSFSTTGSIEPPAPTPAQIAAAAAAQAEAVAAAIRAAEEVAAAIRAAEIATAQTALASILKADKLGTAAEFRAANINVTTDVSLTRLNAEVLKLSTADRANFTKIKLIADIIEFDESFFNVTVRPTVATYAASGVTGVTERILSTINTKILDLPAAKRLDVTAIQEIVITESFVDRVANSETRGSVSAATLIAKGLLPSDTVYKHSVVQGLASYPEGSLNSLAKIEAAIKEQVYKAEAPKRRLAEIKARIAARNK
jgi:hypothetical protein